MTAVMVATLFVVGTAVAFAGVSSGVAPTFPSTVTVGQNNVPANLQIVNSSTSPESAGNETIDAITLVPACGTSSATATGNCPVASADPGVFSLSPAATGGAFTACAGQTFTVTIIDPATGQVQFTPSGGPVVLTQPHTPNDVCRIDFTFSVIKEPTQDAGAEPGLQTAQLGFAQGTSAVNGHVGTGSGSSLVTVTQASPAITTAASAPVAVGGAISDTAALSGGSGPTGTIIFRGGGRRVGAVSGPGPSPRGRRCGRRVPGAGHRADARPGPAWNKGTRRRTGQVRGGRAGRGVRAAGRCGDGPAGPAAARAPGAAEGANRVCPKAGQ
ncbi:MAG: hypothetical protein ACRDS0_21235 [Pseudonocardiaceae bacterium]